MIERSRHPALCLLLLTVVAVALSWALSVYGWGVTLPDGNEELRVQSLISLDGLRWWLRSAIEDFVGFPALGASVVMLFALGLVCHSGLGEAVWRLMAGRFLAMPAVSLAGVILVGLISGLAGNVGYLCWVPAAALWFRAAGLSPVGGALLAYVSVGIGCQTFLPLSAYADSVTLTTREIALALAIPLDPTSSWSISAFPFVSLVLIAFALFLVTWRMTLPLLHQHQQAPGSTPHGRHASSEDRQRLAKVLSLFTIPRPSTLAPAKYELRALRLVLVVALLYLFLIFLSASAPWGFLRSLAGDLPHSPFISSLPLLTALGFAIMGAVYGYATGRYRHWSDLSDGLTSLSDVMATYLLITFFASILTSCLAYSHLDQCLVLASARGLVSLTSATGLVLGGWGPWVLFVIALTFASLASLLMPAASSQWSLLAPVFLPWLYASAGLSPDVAQSALLAGSGLAGTLTPLLAYSPLLLAYVRRFSPVFSYGTLFRRAWPFAMATWLAWAFVGAFYLLV